MKFIVIGISDRPQPWFPPEVAAVISQGRYFSGGRRHHEIVAHLLPPGSKWIDITVPLADVFSQYSALLAPPCPSPLVVFASGDPLFFGFANTLRRQFPEADLVVYPSFNSLQLLAHRLLMPYHDLRIVSLTGRPWPDFDRALIERSPRIGVLTDRQHTPSAIAQRMMEFGYTCYTMCVGEHLGNPAMEQVTTLTLAEASERSFQQPNCVILTARQPWQQTVAPRPYGIADGDFELLDGREKMITKMPIRLLTLQALDLPRRHVLWDIGFCTGSVSIEARLGFPHLQVVAFEVRPECERIMHINARRFGAPGIDVHIGDFMDADLSGLPRPDAVFIGGHGGRLKAILERLLTVAAPGAVVVMNSVTSPVVSRMTDRRSSRELWDDACQSLGLVQCAPQRIVLDSHNPIEILKCRVAGS